MKRQPRLSLLGALCAAFALAAFGGCKSNGAPDTSGTVHAANRAEYQTHKATSHAGAKAENAGAQVEHSAKVTGKNITAALVVTPLVKNAIRNDKMLNDKRNTINVDSKDNVVHLRGAVLNNAMKKRAGQVAQKVLTDHKSTDHLSNELHVKQH